MSLLRPHPRSISKTPFFERCAGRAYVAGRLLGRWRRKARGGDVADCGCQREVEQLGEGPPLNMLPAWLATHRAVRRLPVNDDAVAAGSAAVLGPLALPASPSRRPCLPRPRSPPPCAH